MLNYKLRLRKPLVVFKKYWTIKKITFVSILIAISVVFAILGATIIPITSLPTYKISFTGLPVKISGYIFGPIIGLFVGLLTDLISILFLPSYYHPYYTLASGINGFIPGIVGVMFFKFFKVFFNPRRKEFSLDSKIEKEKKLYEKSNFTNQKLAKKIELLTQRKEKLTKANTDKRVDSFLTFVFMIAVAFFIVITILFNYVLIFNILSKKQIADSFLRKPEYLMLLASSGFILMFFYVIISKFFLKSEKYYTIIPIVVFSALLEFANVNVISLADEASLNISYVTAMFNHIITAPIKIWVNLVVVYYSYKIIIFLINKNSKNSW